MSETNRAGRFLDAFSKIERELRRKTNESKGTPFYRVVAQASSLNSAVARFADDLREFADLRNAIVHERRDGEPIADPHEATVAEIHRIAELLLTPPKIDDLSLSEVIVTSPAETIGRAARRMHEGEFSQLPVYDDGEWAGLLTAETIARWMGAQLEGGIGLLEEETVEEVLPFREETSIEQFLPRNATLFDVVDAFDNAMHAGRNLDALLITHSGKRSQEPLGILTVFDLPAIYRKVTGR